MVQQLLARMLALMLIHPVNPDARERAVVAVNRMTETAVAEVAMAVIEAAMAVIEAATAVIEAAIAVIEACSVPVTQRIAASDLTNP
jgi:hypothetical protein